MKTILATLFSLVSFFAFSQSNDQFRLVGSGTWSTVNDSTYQSTVSFMSDLTGGGFLATQIADTFRLFTGAEKIYRVDTVWGKTFSSATMRVVEYNGTNGIPSGQVMVYDPDGRSTIPQVPFGSTGATAQLQAAVVTYNAKQAASGTVADDDYGDISVLTSVWNIDANTVGNNEMANDAIGSAELINRSIALVDLANDATIAGNANTASDTLTNAFQKIIVDLNDGSIATRNNGTTTQRTLANGFNVMLANATSSTGGTFTPDLSTGAVFRHTVSSGSTLTVANATNNAGGRVGNVFRTLLKNSSGGSVTVSFGTNWLEQDWTQASNLTLANNDSILLDWKSEFKGGTFRLTAMSDLGGGVNIATLPDAFSVVAAEKIAGPDSLLTFQKVVNQIRDSTIFSVPNVAGITTLSTPLKAGDRIKIKSDGSEFYVVAAADTVRFYAADGINVVKKGSLYAIKDYTKTRDFATLSDFLAVAPLCKFTGETEAIYLGKENPLRVLVSAQPKVNNFLTIAKDTVVDGFWLQKFNTVILGENQLYNSQQQVGSSSATGSFFSPSTAFQSGQISSDGTRTATRVVANSICYLYPQSGSSLSAGTVTQSVWAWSAKGTGSINFSGLGTVTVSKIPKRYSHTFTNSTTTSCYVGFTVTGTDTIFFENPQFEAGTLSPYKETINKVQNQTVMYINLGYALIESKRLRLDRLNGFAKDRFWEKGNATPLLNSAINYADYGRRFNTIALDGGTYRITSTIDLNDNVNIEGSGRSDWSYLTGAEHRGTTIIAAIPSTSYLFRAHPRQGRSGIGNTGLKNLTVFVEDATAIRGILDLKECQGSVFQNLHISPYTGASIDTAIAVRISSSSDSYVNVFDNINIFAGSSGNRRVGLFYEGSYANEFNHLSLGGFDEGITIKSGAGVEFSNSLIQSCKKAVRVEGVSTSVRFDWLYTEDSGIAGAPAIQLNGGATSFYRGAIQSAGSTGDTVLVMNGTSKAIFEGVDFRVGKRFRIGANALVNFSHCQSLFPLRDLSYTANAGNVVVSDNTLWNGTTRWGGLQPRNDVTLSRISEAVLRNPVVADSFYMSNATIYAKKQNLIAHSDSLGITTSLGTPDTVKIASNNAVAPDGTTTAERLIFKGTNYGTSSLGWFSSTQVDAFSVGDKFTVSMWVKGLNYGKLRVNVRPYSLLANLATIEAQLDSNQWRLVHVTGTIASKTSGFNTLIFELLPPEGGLLNDTVYVWRAALTKGIWPEGSIKTTTAGVNTTTNIGTVSENGISFAKDLTVPTETYDATGWNGDMTVPTKDAIRDKIESLPVVSGTPWILGAQALSANSNIGSTNAYNVGVTTNGTARLTFDANGGVRSNTITDVVLTPSDSMKISGATVDIAGAVKITGATTATGDITVPTEAYDATGWNGDLTVPTKDAVRDKIEALTGWNHSATQNIDMNSYNITEGNLATFDTVTVTTSAYASGWNGDNTVPTKDAVYDQMETKATKGGDSGTITLGSNTGSLHLESDGTRRMTIPEAGIASTTSATKALFLSSNDSLQYTTIQHGNWSDNAVIANSTRTDTLLNGGVAYGRLIRVGTTVDFTVRFEVGLGSDTTSNIVYMPLPISSNFTSPSTDVIGTADIAAQGVYGGNPIKIERVVLYADDSSDRIAVGFTVDKQGASYPANRIWITAKGSYDIK